MQGVLRGKWQLTRVFWRFALGVSVSGDTAAAARLFALMLIKAQGKELFGMGQVMDFNKTR